MQGWVMLHRQLLEWEWYSDANVSRLFIHCLLKANHKDGSWKGINVKRGQFITSLDRLSSETSLSKSQLRTAIKKLKSTREIAHESTSQHTVITVICYDSYQGGDTPNDTPVTNQSQTDDIQIAPNNNDNNKNNEKNDNKSIVVVDNEIDAFEIFYLSGLVKKSKAAAMRSFAKLVRKEKLDPMVIANKLSDDIRARINSNQFGFDNLHPSTYLNNRRWEDDIEQPKAHDKVTQSNINNLQGGFL